MDIATATKYYADSAVDGSYYVAIVDARGGRIYERGMPTLDMAERLARAMNAADEMDGAGYGI